MSVFDIPHKHERQFGKGFSCRVFVALFLLVSIGVFTASLFFNAQASNEPIPSIEFTSEYANYSNGVPGSWNITKTAGWTGLGTASIVFNVDTLSKLPDKGNDIILVVNRGSNEDDDQFDAAKNALKSLINRFMDDGDNKIALVTFGHLYEIKTDFTDDRDLLLDLVSNISRTSGNANYYQGLNGAERVLRNYTHSDDRDTTVVFLTGGKASEEVLYQESEFKFIKAVYPYVTINAIQYKLGNDIVGALTTVSDNQYVANENTIEDVIFEASVVPYSYENFIITDYIEEFFDINNVDDIETSLGNVVLEYEDSTPKIIWDMSGLLRSGSSAEMRINIRLKSEYISSPGVYRTNKRTTVTTLLPEMSAESISIDYTPILKTDYTITYNANDPSGCTASGVPAEETHYVYEPISYSSIKPTCDGFVFKGWKISDEYVHKINDDYFIMPDKNIQIMAIWTKPSISKSMDGTIHTVETLYGAIAKKSLGANNQYNLDSGLDFKRMPSVTNSIGVKTVASTANDEYPVHYFRGGVTDNNVLFAGICWKAVRTTSTGGVKLIYNGEADENSQCANNRPNHEGYGTATSKKLSGGYYYYGTDFVHDKENNTFSLAGIKTFEKWSETTSESLINKYTCLSADANATCSSLYFVYSKIDSDGAYVMPLGTNISYNSIGRTQYNISGDPASSVGYMFGYSEKSGIINPIKYNRVNSASLFPSTSLNTAFWYADSITYGNDVANQYSLVDAYQVSSYSDYASLVGKYTFRNSSSNYHNNIVYYIAAVSSGYMYYIQLEYGQLLPGVDQYNVLGNGFIDNGNGTYTLTDTFEIKKSEWGSRYNEATGKYICGEIGSGTCAELRYISSASMTYYYYYLVDEKITIGKSHDGTTLLDTITARLYELLINNDEYSEYRFTCDNLDTVCSSPDKLFYIASVGTTEYRYYTNISVGSSVSWDGSKYTVLDVIDISENKTGINTHHFACPTLGQTTCEKAVYLFGYYGSSDFSSMNYAFLENGITTPEEILARMFENRNNSSVKSIVDAWYKRTLIEYGDMIEDVPYCNNRKNRGGNAWDPNEPMSYRTLGFGNNYYGTTLSLDCPDTNDAFTVNSANGNGALTYPVGLLTEDEVIMAGHGVDSGFTNTNSYLETGGSTWTMTPYSHGSENSNVWHWNKYSDYRGLNVNSFYTRPVISIKPGVYIDTGDGTAEKPWTLTE